MEFKEMHAQPQPLMIGNVWNVSSAKAAKKAGFQAIGTSSAAMANSLGHADGEQMSFGELSHLVGRIAVTVDLPLSVDLEAGYGKSAREITANILELAEMGVVGVNLEDSLRDGVRGQVPLAQFQDLLQAVVENLERNAVQVFVNARTDAFLLGHSTPLEETLLRIKACESAGADGIFIPGMVKPSDIQAAVAATSLPINLMCMPDLPSFTMLGGLGVKRISMGNFLFERQTNQMEKSLAKIVVDQSFHSIFNP